MAAKRFLGVNTIKEVSDIQPVSPEHEARRCGVSSMGKYVYSVTTDYYGDALFSPFTNKFHGGKPISGSKEAMQQTFSLLP